jgi:hypothetical protein
MFQARYWVDVWVRKCVSACVMTQDSHVTYRHNTCKQKELLYSHVGNPRVEATTSLYVATVNVALVVTLQLQFTQL